MRMMKTIDFKFADFNTDLGTRRLGAKVRNRLLHTIEESKDNTVALDFTNVQIVSNAFADECLVKAAEHFSLSIFVKKTTFVNVNELAKINIAVAFKRRYPEINELN